MTHKYARSFNPEGVLAYLITFRCYGTWLHGDGRGSMDRKFHNLYGESALPGDAAMEERDRHKLSHVPVRLSAAMREVVDRAIREVCRHRNCPLYALNVQVDHAHLVVAAVGRPELIMNACKSWATRRLRAEGLVRAEAAVWSRHGSTKYLWVESQIDHANAYVLYGQPLPPGM